MNHGGTTDAVGSDGNGTAVGACAQETKTLAARGPGDPSGRRDASVADEPA